MTLVGTSWNTLPWYGTAKKRCTSASRRRTPSISPFGSLRRSYWRFVFWGDRFTESSVLVLGDNIGALSNALSLRGKGPHRSGSSRAVLETGASGLEVRGWPSLLRAQHGRGRALADGRPEGCSLARACLGIGNK